MERLISLRKEKQLTQQKLAEQIGTTQQSIYGYEQGLYEPDIRTLKLIADFFDTSVDYLIDNVDVRRRIEHFEKFELSADEAVHMEKYRKLTPCIQRGINALIDECIDAK